MASFPSRGLLVLAIIFVGLLGCIRPVSGFKGGRTIYVHSSQKIQAAIDRAHPGDHIIVEAGTYAEQLEITTDGISLIGHGATIKPPVHPKTNICSGLAGPDPFGKDTQAGICIHGSGINLAPFPPTNGEHRKVNSVHRRVTGVLVSGFTVSGFSGLGIAVVGAEGALVTKNTLVNGVRYGSLTVGSKDSRIIDNVVQADTATGKPISFIGICMDDTSNVQVAHNDISGYLVGLCVQTNEADVYENTVHNSCIGAYIDPNVDGAQVAYNHISSSNPICTEATSGSFGVWGIAIFGATNSIVEGNTIIGQKTGIPAFFTAGVAVFNNTFPPPEVEVAKGNRIIQNILSDNDLDLLKLPPTTDNYFKGNKCKSVDKSSPAGLCAA